MNDFKSKLPDFKEFSSMASKLFKDVKTSVCEIIEEYKKKRAEEEAAAANKGETQTAEVHVEKKVKTPEGEEAQTATVKVKKKESPKKEEAIKREDTEGNKS
ncbi:hypothetical protein [Legionella maceachernii]|uniref:Uncharacterized protein n=1 Tax=Legionella maceachernii TaxID=466 RepID=A0A0W0WB25_9GAMM|nr:hypothetical protein [Legionella maceachernii]KTD29422.1 hypothetical protein Lmac_0932 [Legionella maceachernii]SJZ95194.1 hypothetical protein SAMN02745128_01568 [Legionella maceachernii]SUP03309.1 Uncharacterised protein [Legionella maceachernii]